MERITDLEFSDFLTNKPLYHKVIAVKSLNEYEGAFMEPADFKDKAFKFLCPAEKEIHTFKTGFGLKGSYTSLAIMIRDSKEQLPFTFDDKSRKLLYTFQLHGICQSCNHHIHFLIKTSSDKTWDEREKGLNITIQKVGQDPPMEINLDSNLKKYLTEDDQNYYKKALINLSISYGIGAFAYFRRVIENEIKRIIKDISELEFDGVTQVRKAWEIYKTDFQMSKLIDTINPHLPTTLKQLGDNPIRLLYEQLSGGIHDFTEEECVQKALNIDTIFKYIVQKLNEEKFQLEDIRLAMQNLRKNNS